ncbi:MAG: serine protease, partial [Bacteroidota bacterium]
MTTRYFLLIALLTGFVLSTYAQEETSEEPKGLYLISLADKEGTPYSVDEPEAFLSERSLERRRKHNTEVTEADLPTSPRYEKEILGMGIPIWQRSKWMNAFV